MKTRHRFQIYLLINILLLISCTCTQQQGANNILIQAENIVEQQPDSALRLLNTVLFPENWNKSRFNKYNLLLLQAKDKSYKDITSDTIIFAVKDYYLQKKDNPHAAMAAYYCGRLWHERNNMNEAVKAYMEAEKLADKTDNDNLKGLIQSNLGILHREHSSYPKAIELLKNAVQLYSKAKNYKNEINSLRLIGDCFGINEKIDSSFYYYNESLKLAVLHNMPKQQSDVKNDMGATYLSQENYEQAKNLFQESLALADDSVSKARILLNIAQVYGYENKADSVNFYIDKAMALNNSNPWLIQISYRLKSEIAEKNNRYQNALIDYKEYYNYTLKVWDNAKNNALLDIQAKYDYIKLKNAESEIIIKQQKVALILLVALLAAGIIIFFYYGRDVQNKELLLESKERIAVLQQMATDFSNEKNDIRHLLLEQFDILRKTALIEAELNDAQKKNGASLLHKFNKIVYGQDALDWNKLYQSMNTLKDGYYDTVKANFPQWNETDFRIFCLTNENQFRDKEIAIILNKSVFMIRKIRSKIRKDVEGVK